MIFVTFCDFFTFYRTRQPTDQTELNPPSKRNETHRVKGIRPTDQTELNPPT